MTALSSESGLSLVTDALLAHLGDVNGKLCFLKTPCHFLSTLDSRNGLFSLPLSLWVYVQEESPSFEHGHELFLKELLAALTHHLGYFLGSFHLLLALCFSKGTDVLPRRLILMHPALRLHQSASLFRLIWWSRSSNKDELLVAVPSPILANTK